MVRLRVLAAVAFLAAAAAARAAIGAEGLPEPPFHVKLSEITLPENARPGSFRRILQPFEGWLLICDEDLSARKRVCNATQTLTDRDGRMTFSWSLAATTAGRPAFIIRVPHAIAADGYAVFSFSPKDNPIPVSLASCDQTVCLGFLAVTKDIQKRIEEKASVVIEIGTHFHSSELKAPLAGLAQAVKSIN